MALKHAVLVLFAMILSATVAHAQPAPNGSVPAHVICDSGCSGGGTVTVVQPTGTNLHTVVDSGTVTAVTAITNALPAGSNVIGHVIVDSSGVVHVVIDSSASLTVTGPLTDTQLRASAVPVSLATAPTTPVTNASLDGTTLASIKGDLDKIPTSPAQESGNLATIATNSGTQATAANQTTGNASLSTIATNTTNVAGAVDQPGTTSPGYVMVDGATDPMGMTRATLADPSGALLVVSRPAVPPALLFPCNALRRLNCR